MTHNYVPTTVDTPHLESTPLSQNNGATPTIIENVDVPMVMSNKRRISGQMMRHSIMNKKWSPNSLKRKLMNLRP
jgi:hypothetical protein